MTSEVRRWNLGMMHTMLVFQLRSSSWWHLILFFVCCMLMVCTFWKEIEFNWIFRFSGVGAVREWCQVWPVLKMEFSAKASRFDNSANIFPLPSHFTPLTNNPASNSTHRKLSVLDCGDRFFPFFVNRLKSPFVVKLIVTRVGWWGIQLEQYKLKPYLRFSCVWRNCEFRMFRASRQRFIRFLSALFTSELKKQ